MRRGILGPLLIFVAILAVLQIVFPVREGFFTGKPNGSSCDLSEECTSRRCHAGRCLSNEPARML